MGNKLRVLIVDDNEISRKLITYFVEIMEAQVFVACDGEMAMSVLLNNDMDLVVLDWRMPKLDGLEMLQLADSILQKARPRMIKLPVVIYTDSNTQLIQLPLLRYFSVRKMLSKKKTSFQQLESLKAVFENVEMDRSNRLSKTG